MMKKVSLLLLMVVFVACNNGANKEMSETTDLGATFGYSQGDYNEMVVEESETRSKLLPEVIENSGNHSPGIVQEQKIIKTARLEFETQELEKTHQKILALAAQYKGIVQADNSGKSYNSIHRNMTIRVPSEHFMSVVDGISEGVEYFDARSITRQDVTEEFVDIQARLKAKNELEKRYLELLVQAKNVKEMLEIERELSKIREEIEAKEGRLKFLESRVSMSTINLSFYKTTVETGVRVSYGTKMTNSLKGGWEGVSIFFLGVLYLWPLFLLVIIVIMLIRWLIRRNRKNK